jgi:hypothetical protein
MPPIPGNWASICLKDPAGAAPRGQQPEEARRPSKRKTSSGGSSRSGGSKKRRAEESIVSPDLNLLEVTPPACRKGDIVQAVVDGQADRIYRNEIRDNIRECADGVGGRDAHIEAMVAAVSKSMHQIIGMTGYKSVLAGVDTAQIVYTNELQSVPKAYEDTYLRQAVSAGERECVRGQHCECRFIDGAQPFVGVEYLLPWERSSQTANGLCLPCIRAATQALFYDILHSGTQVTGLVQKFYNEHSREGEYKLSAMLFCPPSGPVHNLPMPVMRHQRNFYRVHVKNSVHFMQQVGVDFQAAPCS